MADRYAELAVGNNDWSNVNTWKATTDGATGASVPTDADDVYINADSVQGGGATLTVDVNAACLSFTWTNATNNPTLAGAFQLAVKGNFVLIAAMTWSLTGLLYFFNIDQRYVTTAGNTITGGVNFNGGSHAYISDLQDNFIMDTTKTFIHGRHRVDVNSHTITCGLFHSNSGSTHSLYGVATINCTGWFVEFANFQMTGTPVINVSGTGGFNNTGTAETFTTVNLIGTAHTISGNCTISTLTLLADTTQTITFTDGINLTITTPTLTGSIGKVKTLVGSGTGGWTITKAGGGVIRIEYIALSYGTYSSDGAAVAVNSTDNGNNIGWVFFPFTATTSPGLTASATVDRAMTYDRASQPALTIVAAIVRNIAIGKSTQPALTVAVTIARALAWDRAISAGLTAAVSLTRSMNRTIATIANLTVSVAIGFTISRVLVLKVFTSTYRKLKAFTTGG